MAGVLLASTDGQGWTVESVDLRLTGRRPGPPGGTEPLGDGPQLIVRRYGRMAGYFPDVSYLTALGVDMSRMTVVLRWL